MEFGLTTQGYAPGPVAHDSAAEHEVFLDDLGLSRSADRNNWKFCWLSEHHALPEFSHLSANET